MTIDEGKAMLATGVKFGDVFPHIAEPDHDELRRFFCCDLPPRFTEPFQPVKPKAIAAATKPPSLKPSQQGYTGDMCQRCSSMKVVRTGTCAACQECGESIGGCS